MHPSPSLRSRHAFTLIEMMLVVAIIGILAVLLFPVANRARRTAKNTKAMHEIKQLETAFRAYNDEYRKWPTGIIDYEMPNPTQNEVNLTGLETLDPLVRMLAGSNKATKYNAGPNPRQIPFFEGASTNSAGAFVDPWGNPYKYMMDFNNDGVVHVEFTGNDWNTNLTSVAVAIWSRGADADDTRKGWAQCPHNW